MTWDRISTKVLADCGRCCCLCRRFKPIQLQVHHIVPKGEGGKDELDNAIALCLTCHTDVHTKAPFTRRFTVEELRAHRDRVYQLVAEGKLVSDEDKSGSEEMPLAVAEAVSRSSRRGPGFDLTPAAIRVLVAAASSDEVITVLGGDKGLIVRAGGRNLVDAPHNPRLAAEYLHAVEQLEQRGLIAATSPTRYTFMVTHPGYLLADELQAEGGHVPVE